MASLLKKKTIHSSMGTAAVRMTHPKILFSPSGQLLKYSFFSVIILNSHRFVANLKKELPDNVIGNVTDIKYCVCCSHAFLLWHATPHCVCITLSTVYIALYCGAVVPVY